MRHFGGTEREAVVRSLNVAGSHRSVITFGAGAESLQCGSEGLCPPFKSLCRTFVHKGASISDQRRV
jgi:hypothetical protein